MKDTLTQEPYLKLLKDLHVNIAFSIHRLANGILRLSSLDIEISGCFWKHGLREVNMVDGSFVGDQINLAALIGPKRGDSVGCRTYPINALELSALLSQPPD